MKRAVNAIRRSASDRTNVRVAPITGPRDQLVQTPRWMGYCSMESSSEFIAVGIVKREARWALSLEFYRK
jgi:hypothetical protein